MAAITEVLTHIIIVNNESSFYELQSRCIKSYLFPLSSCSTNATVSLIYLHQQTSQNYDIQPIAIRNEKGY